jgi:hypothetical protein
MSNVKHRLRETLAESHISAIAIAVLLLWAINSAFVALRDPFFAVVNYFITAVAILGIPSSGPITLHDKVMLFVTGQYLFTAFASFAAAWLFSHWIYGTGPLRSLNKCGTRLRRRNYVCPAKAHIG